MFNKLYKDRRFLAFIVSFFFLEFSHAFLDILVFSHLSPDLTLIHITIFPLFSALVASLIGYYIEPKIENTFFKGEDSGAGEVESKKVLSLIFLGFALFAFLFIMSGFYILNDGEGAVLTKFTGNKVIVNDTGIHYRLTGLTDIKRYDLRKTVITKEVKTISTKDNKIVDASIILTYSINDLYTLAVKNKDPDIFLNGLIEPLVIKEISDKDYAGLGNKDVIEQAVYQNINKEASNIGININNVILSIVEPISIRDARSDVQANVIESEGLITRALNEKTAKGIQIEAIKGLTAEQLDYLAKIELYNSLKDKQNVIYLLPNNFMGSFPIGQNANKL